MFDIDSDVLVAIALNGLRIIPEVGIRLRSQAMLVATRGEAVFLGVQSYGFKNSSGCDKDIRHITKRRERHVDQVLQIAPLGHVAPDKCNICIFLNSLLCLIGERKVCNYDSSGPIFASQESV